MLTLFATEHLGHEAKQGGAAGSTAFPNKLHHLNVTAKTRAEHSHPGHPSCLASTGAGLRRVKAKKTIAIELEEKAKIHDIRAARAAKNRNKLNPEVVAKSGGFTVRYKINSLTGFEIDKPESQSLKAADCLKEPIGV